MNLSCLYHRWIAGKNAGIDGVPLPSSYRRHADSCPRCAVHSQRLRSLDSRFQSLEKAQDTELPSGLHSKIMAAVREVHLHQVHAAVEQGDTESKGRRGALIAFCGAAAAVALTLFALNHDSSEKVSPPNSAIATADPAAADLTPVDPLPAPAVPSELVGSPIESIEKIEGQKNFVVPTASRMVQFTGDLPALLIAKVSQPYESEMEFIASDLKSATNFLSSCLFVPEVLENSGL